MRDVAELREAIAAIGVNFLVVDPAQLDRTTWNELLAAYPARSAAAVSRPGWSPRPVNAEDERTPCELRKVIGNGHAQSLPSRFSGCEVEAGRAAGHRVIWWAAPNRPTIRSWCGMNWVPGLGNFIAVAEGPEAAQPFLPEVKAVDAYAAAILDQIWK